MATACIPQVTFRGEGFAKSVVARFDTPHASSDGGAILLKSVDTHLRLTKRLAGCPVDERQPGKIRLRPVISLIASSIALSGGPSQSAGGPACGSTSALDSREGSRSYLMRSRSFWRVPQHYPGDGLGPSPGTGAGDIYPPGVFSCLGQQTTRINPDRPSATQPWLRARAKPWASIHSIWNLLFARAGMATPPGET